jgi:2-desacetyl-2-hydroxyethyl bacteriochlorophyllide A dehydrogenase
LKTIILKEPFQLEFTQKNLIEKHSEDEAIVKIRRIGICGTDYHAYAGKQPFFTYPRVLGHELGAEIVSIDSDNDYNLKIGDKVSIEPYINCGQCDTCIRGFINACENLKVLGVHTDGGMTEFVKVPLRKLHKSDVLSFDQLALVEFLSIGLHAVHRAKITENDLVLIVGAGPIGLSAAQFAMLKNAKVLVADFNTKRLDFVMNKNLAHQTIEVKESLTADLLREQTGGLLPTVVLDATGNANSMNNCFNLVAHGGRIAFIGLFQGDVVFNDPNFHRREITLLASRNSLPEDFKTIIRLMENGEIDARTWISHRTSFDELPTVFSEWMNPESQIIKGIVELD